MRNFITAMTILMLCTAFSAHADTTYEEHAIWFFFAGQTGMEAEGVITNIDLTLDKEYPAWSWPMYNTYSGLGYTSLNGALGNDWIQDPECWPSCDLSAVQWAGSADTIRTVADLDGKKLGTLISVMFLKFPTTDSIKFWRGWEISSEGYQPPEGVTLWAWYWGEWGGYETWWVQFARKGSWPQFCDRPENQNDPRCTDTEVCNGVDDDSDGLTDENLGKTTCGAGECKASVDSCIGGVPQTCTPGAPGTETCGDGIDQDCSGADLSCPGTTDNGTINNGNGGSGCFISSMTL